MATGTTVLTISEFIVFDWYDGIVGAIAHAECESYLLKLVAFSQEERLKIYVLVRLADNELKEIVELIKGCTGAAFEWNRLVRRLRKILKNNEEEAYLVANELQAATPFEALAINSEVVRKASSFSLDIVFDHKNITFWADLVRPLREIITD